MMAYDSTEDTKKHIALVSELLENVAHALRARAIHHDESKFYSPEKEMFDVYRPLLDTLDIQSADYQLALAAMGGGLQHHYKVNRHHPEHFENGINGMTLIDLLEMVCDWSAASKRTDQNGLVNMAWANSRFKIGTQLSQIIENTLREIE